MITFKSHIKAQDKETLINYLSDIINVLKTRSDDMSVIINDENSPYTGYWSTIKIDVSEREPRHGKTHTANLCGN